MTTGIAAKDAMCDLFRLAWAAHAPAIVGSVPHIVFPWDTVQQIEDAKAYWARISFRTVTTYQATFRGPLANPRRWRVEGLVTVQFFAPMQDEMGARNLEVLSPIGRDCYAGQKAADCVWFRRPRIQELNPDGKWHRANAIAVYEYDEIR
jgi:hypothetical protein